LKRSGEGAGSREDALSFNRSREVGLRDGSGRIRYLLGARVEVRVVIVFVSLLAKLLRYLCHRVTCSAGDDVGY
jgi:hypothetical protein